MNLATHIHFYVICLLNILSLHIFSVEWFFFSFFIFFYFLDVKQQRWIRVHNNRNIFHENEQAFLFHIYIMFLFFLLFWLRNKKNQSVTDKNKIRLEMFVTKVSLFRLCYRSARTSRNGRWDSYTFEKTWS